MAIDVNKVQIEDTKTTSYVSSDQKIAFRGATYSMQNDTVELSSKKQGMSNGTKIGLVALLTTAIIGGICIFTHKKPQTPSITNLITNEWDKLVNSVKLSNLPENLTFTPFNTKEEAVKYAKDIFKIQEVETDKISLNLLNDTLEAIVDISNKNHGKFYVPRIIRGTTKTNAVANLQGDPADANMFGVLELHKPIIDLYDTKLDNIINKNIIEKRRNNIKDIIYHEFGHWQDEMANKATILKDNATFERICVERYMHNNPESFFITDAGEQTTAGKISEYSKNSIGEFIAETYKAMIKGESIPDDVTNLYRKYNGPKLN